jgi:hypothetical protein
MDNEVVTQLNDFFSLLEKEKWDAALNALGHDFFAFESGRRYSAQELIGLLRDVFGEGNRYRWRVTDTHVVQCNDVAWIAYRNIGDVIVPDGSRVERQWLETAFLKRHGARWKIGFLSSMRVEGAN